MINGHYDSQPLNRCARLMAIGHGGQILVSGITEALLRGGLPDQVALVDLGQHRLRDLFEPVAVFGVAHRDLETRKRSSLPPLQSAMFIGQVSGRFSAVSSSTWPAPLPRRPRKWRQFCRVQHDSLAERG